MVLVKCVGCLKESDNLFWHENYSVDGSRMRCDKCCRTTQYLAANFRLWQRADGTTRDAQCVGDGCMKPITRVYSQIWEDDLLCFECRRNLRPF